MAPKKRASSRSVTPSTSTPSKAARTEREETPNENQSSSAAVPTSPAQRRSTSSAVPIAAAATPESSPANKSAKTLTGTASVVTQAAAAVAEKDSQEQDTYLESKSGVVSLEDVVLRSNVIAPDVSGIRRVAVSPDETEVVVARENGSLVLYHVEYFQNIPHFTQVRHTGGRVRRTITQLKYLDLSASSSPALHTTSAASGSSHAAGGAVPGNYLVASFLSGQIVIFDSRTLFPVSVYQRTGGAIWDLCIAGPRTVLAAVADGSWHQLRVEIPSAPNPLPNNSASSSSLLRVPRLVLQRIIPGIPGADRALSVTCAAAASIAVGTDDAGNVHAWRIGMATATGAEEEEAKAGGGLTGHEVLWTSRLSKGMGLCCTILSAGPRPAVAVGSSIGDVVLLDISTGHAFSTFSQHKGPVCTVLSDPVTNTFYASGWHESLRSYCCDTASGGEWYPAEVKRRTHYHEASELVLLKQRRLLLSASRDGTIMFSPVASLFSAPAMYVNVTTQQFAFAQRKNVLLQSRLDRVEAFRTDSAARHWVPLFAHNLHGKFHLNGLWCDADLHYVVFSTDERVVLARVCWRDGAEEALVVHKIEEVVELSAGRGVLDVRFVKTTPSTSEGSSTSEGCVYILTDDEVICITLTEGHPVVHTAFTKSGSTPHTLVVQDAVLYVCGFGGTWRCDVAADGTPDVDSLALDYSARCSLARQVPMLTKDSDVASSSDSAAEEDKEAASKTVSSSPVSSCQATKSMVVGLSTHEGRYVKNLVGGAAAAAATMLPKSLPHDTIFIACLSQAVSKTGAIAEAGRNNSSNRLAGKRTHHASTGSQFVGYFSKGLIYVSERDWRMAGRLQVEAAFVMKDGQHVLVLERNLEKTLESLPLCWKVRRFGN